MCRRNFRTRLGRARVRARREDEFLDLTFPTEDAIVGIGCWSVVKVAIEYPVTEDSPRVVEAVSDCSSGEAGFDGILFEGGERRGTTGSAGCSNADGVKVGNMKSRSVRIGNESSLSIENLITKN